MKWRLVVTALLLVASFFSISSLTVEGSLVQIWATRYDGPSGGNDAARAIAVDARGAVYVTGRSMSGGTSENDYHYATIKYDIDGNQVWVARYDGGGDQGDDAQAIDIDGSGNVYVTGWSSRPASAMGVTDYATVKYDANGNQLWVARYSAGGGNSSNIAHAIMVDKLGNVYVTGQSELMGIGRDWATIKYDSNGNQLWVVRYDGPGHGGDEAAKLVVDGQGNVHVSGKVYGGSTTFFDHATVKYDANGNQLWAAIYDGPAHGDDSGGEIGLDSSGNLYVAFSSSANVYNNHYEYATIKYDTSGNRLWVARYDGGHVEDMAVDASGNAYVTGYGGAGIGTNDYVTINYDTNGNQRWVARYDGPVSGEDVPRAVSVDSSGNVYVTGNSQGNSADYGDYGTVKYSSNGSTMGVARYNGPGNGSDTATAIALDGSGNVYVTGVSLGITSFDYATVKIFFTTSPLVTTDNATSITSNSARLNGTLTSMGTASSANVSFQLGTGSGNYSHETTSVSVNATGAFSANISSLSVNTTYYFRAKAVGDGTSYGAEKSFATILPGDATGDGIVDARDITKVERIIAHLDSPTPGADANQDGNTNALDITKVERIIARLD